MLATRIIKKISDIPKGNFRCWFEPKDLAHSAKFQWDEVFVNVCYHRADHEWTNEQHKELQNLLKITAPDLRNYRHRDFFEYVSINPFFHEYLIDDFPAEMDWMREKNSHFEETKSELINKKPMDPKEAVSKTFPGSSDGLLCINTSKFPTHHVWWKNKAQVRSRHIGNAGATRPGAFHLTSIFRYRLVYEWEDHEYKQMQGFIKENRQSMTEHYCTGLMQNLNRLQFTENLECLSGLQFLCDDFPSEMDFIPRDFFVQATERLQNVAAEHEEPDYDSSDCYYMDYHECEKIHNELLVVHWATKPSHHTWWQIKVQVDYDEKAAYIISDGSDLPESFLREFDQEPKS